MNRGDVTEPRPPAPRTPRLPGPDDFPASGPHALATIWQRGAARALDELLLLMPVFLVLLVAEPDLLLDPATSGSSSELVIPVWITAVSVVIGVAYETALIAWRGQTLGKFALGIRVARYADGRRPDVGQAALRCLLPTAFAVLCAAVGADVLALLIYFTALGSPLLRGWHDIAGGTVVVRTR